METNGERREAGRRCIKTSKKLYRSRSRETHSVRCFFRPLFAPLYELGSGWQKVLELPKEFAATVEDKVGQAIELRNGLGEKWPVVLKSYDGILALRRGWQTFVDEHELEEYDLLVFRSIDSHFKVEVYSKLCDEKLSSRPPSVARFYKPLDQSSWIHRLVLPPYISACVADKIGLETRLENALGEQWTVRFSSYNGRVAFERGWKEFANYHNLEERDILVFRGFNNGSLFEVEVYNGRTFCQKACRRSLIRAQQEEHGKGKRKIGTSFPLPDVDLGSPHIEPVNCNSRGKGVAGKLAVSSKGTRSRPQETSNVNQVEPESPDDSFGPVTCLAVTSGKELVVVGLPPLMDGHGKKGAEIKNFMLMDEESRLWPASYNVGIGILCSSWGEFAAVNGVEAGHVFSFAAHDEYPRTYKICVLRSL